MHPFIYIYIYVYILHCGVRVFANAESLFYYAKEGRRSKQCLTQEEIQALLSQVAITTDDQPPKEPCDESSKESDNVPKTVSEESTEEQTLLNTSLNESKVSIYSNTDSSQLTTSLSTSEGDFPLTPHSSDVYTSTQTSSTSEEECEDDPYTAPLEALPSLHTLEK